MPLRKRLQDLREECGMGYEDLADTSKGLSPDIVKDVEEGQLHTSIPIETLVAWAEKMDLKEDTIHELIARRMAEERGCGRFWRIWREAASCLYNTQIND